MNAHAAKDAKAAESTKDAKALYGLMAEFRDAEPLLHAARQAFAAGYREIDAYSPFSIEGLAEAIGFKTNRVPLITLIGGIVGGAGIYGLQYYSAVLDYPINVGGRPLHSWPAFIPATFEMVVLGAALATFFGMLILNGLPRLIHPVFGARDFDLAARNRFFLCVRAGDARFDAEGTRRFLETQQPIQIIEVESERM